MTDIADKIMRRVRGHGKGVWVCSAKDFLDLGSRAAVDQALSRLAKTRKLRRVRRGLYDLPRPNPLLNTPSPALTDSIVSAVMRDRWTDTWRRARAYQYGPQKWWHSVHESGYEVGEVDAGTYMATDADGNGLVDETGAYVSFARSDEAKRYVERVVANRTQG